ncbi:hypothetical protein [Bizionia paragorgiae]|uniref:hypothetical protein n=1 Tax=Bizionia paragorgiae TaxID=283786 RepID=UPI003A8DD2CB
MKTLLLKSTLILFTLSLLTCKNEGRITYKYAEQPDLITCDLKNADLYNEAVYSFENDILTQLDESNQGLLQAYKKFILLTLYGHLKVEDIASEHSLKLAKQLKKDKQLWMETAGARSLNHEGLLMDCITNTVKDKDLQTTFNALLSTNSLNPRTILTPLRNNPIHLLTDGSVKSFMAFEYYYPALMDIEASQLTAKDKPSADNASDNVNKKPALELKQEPKLKDIHEGHNHD